MTESVVADFTTDVIPDTAAYGEPVTGRVLMSDKRVVIATPEDKRTIPIDAVFDLAYGSAPSDLRRFFETTVTIAFETDGGRGVALVEGADDKVERFTNLLFKAIINGTDALVKHPARIGGRITDNAVVPMTVSLNPGTVSFDGSDPFAIEVSTVTHFERMNREVKGQDRSVLSVRHTPEMQALTSEITLPSNRKMNILGRFLRIEYSQLREALEDTELSDRETQALVGLYSGGTDASLAGMLGMESNQVTMLLNGLVEKDLLQEGESGMELTDLGKLAVSDNIEQINT